MTTKQRAYLKSLAMTMDPIFQIGKSSMTPGLTQAIARGIGSAGTDQDQRAEKLCGRSVRAGAACGRTYPFPGCAGDRKEDRSVQRGKRQ